MSNERQLLVCKRCYYGAKGEWRRRTKGHLPKSCPQCKSRLWDTDEVRGRGRPPKPVVEEPVTVTADTIAEFKAEETAPVMHHDVPMMEHGDHCGCTECRLWRGEL